jgi:tetratricopeptide (TPR) repeat protein
MLEYDTIDLGLSIPSSRAIADALKMKEITVDHLESVGSRRGPQVRVAFRSDEFGPARIVEAPFDFVITDAERQSIQWYLEEYLRFPWGEFRTRADRVEGEMVRLGEKLFEAVFGSREASELYDHVADDLSNTRFAIYADSSEGISLPWELLQEPKRGNRGEIALLARSFVRGHPGLAVRPISRPIEGTVNILMVISRPRGPGDDLPFRSDARPLLETLRAYRDHVRIDILRPPTLEQLHRVLRERPNYYHVLHFDGLGGFRRSFDKKGGRHLEDSDPVSFLSEFGRDTERREPGRDEGFLLFEDDRGGPVAVSGEELGRPVADSRIPLVVLNACQSAMTRPYSPYPSIASHILESGARAVLAMAYMVFSEPAAQFVARFYRGMIEGEEVGRAVAIARRELASRPERQSPIGMVPLRDWIVPVLFEAAPVRLRSPVSEGLRLGAERPTEQGQFPDAIVGLEQPAPPSFGFVGRDAIILDLERALRAETNILLRGMAGIGKTQAVSQFAHWWTETGAIDGPSFFFSFERYLPLSGVCDRIGRAFNERIRSQIDRDWELLDTNERRHLVIQVLRQVRCLLIWDNFETVSGLPEETSSEWTPEEQAALRDFLRDLMGGRTNVLLTSRRDESWLGPIYGLLDLGGLDLSESQELAVRVLEQSGLEPAEIRELPPYNDLLVYLRGNPLAIQVILPELRRMTPGDLLGALGKGEIGLGRDDPEQGRERSLAASLRYCLKALDETLRRRLGILAIFQGFVDARVLTEISSADLPAPIRDLDVAEWTRNLDQAAGLGLLQRLDGGLYSVHPALPWFFHSVLEEAFPHDIGAIESAFSEFYGAYGLYLTDRFRSDGQVSIIRLAREESNFRHALRLCRQHGRWEDVRGILWGLNCLLVNQGRWVEWERVFAPCEADALDDSGLPRSGRESLWVTLITFQQEIAHYRRDFATEEAILLRLVAYFDRTNDPGNKAIAFYKLGLIVQQQRRFVEAEERFRQSLAIMDSVGDELGMASVVHQLGLVAQEQGKLDEAIEWYHRSLRVMERIGDQGGISRTFHNLGVVSQQQANFGEAKRWFRESLRIGESLGDVQGQSDTAHQLGLISQLQGDFDEAERWYRRSLELKTAIGNEYGMAQTLHNLGVVAAGRDRLDEAEQWLARCLEIERAIADEYGQARTSYQLGIVQLKRGDLGGAKRSLDRAAELFHRYPESSDAQGTLDSIQQLINVLDSSTVSTALRTQLPAGEAKRLIAEGRLREAEEALNREIEMCKERRDLDAAADLFRQRGEVRVRMRSYERARWDYKKAIELYRNADHLATLSEVEIELAKLEFQTGLLNDADRRLSDAAKHAEAAGKPERITPILGLREMILAQVGSSS